MKIIRYIIIFIFINSCIYEGGNIGRILTLQVNLKTDFMLKMIDSLHNDNRFKTPEELSYITNHNNNLSHLTSRDIYFNKKPKEIYTINFSHAESIIYIYSVKDSTYYNGDSKISETELKRIKKRVLVEFFSVLKDKGEEFKFNKNDIYLNYRACGNSLLLCND